MAKIKVQSLSIPPDLLEAAKKVAASDCRSFSNYACKLIRDDVNRRLQDAPGAVVAPVVSSPESGPVSYRVKMRDGKGRKSR